MGRLTTHVLDMATGRPAAGLTVELWRMGTEPHALGIFATNPDGRVDGSLLAGADLTAGVYELRFHAGAYLRAQDASRAEPLFLDVIPIRFGIADASAHYHVPLLLSPFGYSTYRGS